MFLFGDERLHDRPLLVGQIRWIMFAHGIQRTLSGLFKHALKQRIKFLVLNDPLTEAGFAQMYKELRKNFVATTMSFAGKYERRQAEILSRPQEASTANP